MYCRQCRHKLAKAADNACPRCRLAFDPLDVTTYRLTTSHRLRNIIVGIGCVIAGWLLVFLFVNLDPHFKINDGGGGVTYEKQEMSMSNRIVFALCYGTVIGAILIPIGIFFAGMADNKAPRKRLPPGDADPRNWPKGQ